MYFGKLSVLLLIQRNSVEITCALKFNRYILHSKTLEYSFNTCRRSLSKNCEALKWAEMTELLFSEQGQEAWRVVQSTVWADSTENWKRKTCELSKLLVIPRSTEGAVFLSGCAYPSLCLLILHGKHRQT